MDHDGDGRMGGSMKGTSMAKEPEKKAPKMSDSEKLEKLIALAKANGWSLPKGME